MPDSDYAADGWQWLYAHPDALPTPAATRELFG
jgi:hypothetical protein